MTLQFGASLTDDTRSVNYDRNTFIIQATGVVRSDVPSWGVTYDHHFDNARGEQPAGRSSVIE